MNKKYIYLDGKVIISDENEEVKLSPYYDNLDDVLVCENVIEAMENEITNLKREREVCKNDRKQYSFPAIFSVFVLAPPIMISLFCYILTSINPFMVLASKVFVNTNLGVFMSIITSIISLPVDIGIFFQNKFLLKEEDRIQVEIEILERQLILKKEKLEELKKDKKREREDTEFRVVSVDDKKQLEVLKNYLSFYSHLIRNERKYIKYYNQGRLDEILRKNYSVKSIEEAKKYLEEKGPILSKKKR